MNKRWILVADQYSGIEESAINLLYGAVAEQLDYVLPIQTPDKADRASNLILIGQANANEMIRTCVEQKILDIPCEQEGYALYVGTSIFCQDAQMIVLAGVDEAGVLYGCMDFCNRYLGDIARQNGDLWNPDTYQSLLDRTLTPWQIRSAPAIKRRAIWTWGHVIYDYRKFFENMARLRLNEIIIWNDVAPLNAKKVVEYAHRYNIKVIWGFAWGWGCKGECKRNLERYGQELLSNIKREVLNVYQTQYADTNADGIYFQSFTELSEESINGKCIAETVTELVNDIAGTLLELYPNLHIQFGLHATSVRNRLNYIQRVDPRIYIVWEDCGSFPYDYWADRTEGFEETLDFTKEILQLRGEQEKWGAVFKGMLKLDWSRFEHFSAPYILGERTEQYIKNRQTEKNSIWKLQQGGWLRNADLLRRTLDAVKESGRETIAQALVEDAMLENEIAFPVALFAEMLWENQVNTEEIIERIAKYPCVHFA